MLYPLSIRLCGYGGQGIILASIILGEVMVKKKGLYTVQTQSYGSEARGGQCQAELIVSDKPIQTPISEKNDILIALFQTAFDAYITRLKENGLLFVDSELVSQLTDIDARTAVYKVPATKMALDLGNKMAANMVMLGYFQAKTNICTKEELLEAVKDNVKPHFWEINKNAVEAGVKFALNQEEYANEIV